jgi:epoxide hydrolase-like predicted phosphatase
MIKAIVLDIGGVLIRTENQSGREQLAQDYHLEPGIINSLVFNSPIAESASIGKADTSDIWNHVASELNLSSEALTEFVQLFWSGDHLDRELIEYIKSCRPEYTTALLSNAWNNMREFLAESYDIREEQTVDHILISAELGVAKPDQKIYQILSDTIGHEFEEILFVDDFIENIQSAKNLGIHTIHYQRGMNLINEIKLLLEGP